MLEPRSGRGFSQSWAEDAGNTPNSAPAPISCQHSPWLHPLGHRARPGMDLGGRWRVTRSPLTWRNLGNARAATEGHWLPEQMPARPPGPSGLLCVSFLTPSQELGLGLWWGSPRLPSKTRSRTLPAHPGCQVGTGQGGARLAEGGTEVLDPNPMESYHGFEMQALLPWVCK